MESTDLSSNRTIRGYLVRNRGDLESGRAVSRLLQGLLDWTAMNANTPQLDLHQETVSVFRWPQVVETLPVHEQVR